MTQAIINVLNYIFILTPGVYFQYSFIISLIAALCFLFAIGIMIYRGIGKNKLAKKLVKPFTAEFILLAIFLLLYVFFRLNNIAVFSARICLFLLLGWLLFAIYRFIYALTKKYRLLKSSEESRTEEVSKYFLLKNKSRKKEKKRR